MKQPSEPFQEPSQEVASSKDKKRLVSPLKIFFAILISASILFYYLHGQDWHALLDAVEEANLYLACSAALVMVLNVWFFEVYLRGLHFTWFHGPFPWRDYFWMRGALYLVVLINGPLSGAARILYIVKKTQATFTLYAGIALFRIILRAGAIALLMVPLTWFVFDLPVFRESGLNRFYWTVFIIWNLGMMVDFYCAFRYEKFFGLSRFFHHKFDHAFFKPFQIASPYQWLWTMLVGFFPIFIFIAAYWLMAYAFNIIIPFFYFVVCLVFVLFLSNLPISFGGFGTTTMAWMLFFGNYADEAALLSFTLFLPMARLVLHGVIGLLCLKPALTDLIVLLTEARQQNNNKEKETEELKKLFFD